MSAVLFLLLLGVAFALRAAIKKRRLLEEQLARTSHEAAFWKARSDSFEQAAHTETARAENLSAALAAIQDRLNRIEGLGVIEDALAYSARLRELAEVELSRAKAEAKALQEQIRRFVASAENEKARLIEEGEAKAREIAGKAYELSKQEESLRRTIEAIENTIHGYGDEYLVPTSVLLDDLEQRYGFADVGQRLKNARKNVADMITRGEAALCDYVEANRRETATAFIVDAFNGKVDSILTGVKSDNYGKLRQKILDAFTLVNHHGLAFRKARILDRYLDAQIEVLRWAVAAQELRRQEKEEQKAIREQMREEEKARREYEKAIKEATRDEEVAKKALEKARADLEKAGDAERAKFEAKLAELTDRLHAAEEKNKRALSMAQQTRSGNVYVISNVGSFGEHVYKIGMTRRLDPEDRIRELGDASVPFPFDIHAMIRTDDAPGLEKELHRAFLQDQVNKVNPRKEFFRVPLERIRHQVDAMQIDAAWTMTASCAEWRESQALSERLAADATEYARWSEGQLREHERAILTSGDGEED